MRSSLLCLALLPCLGPAQEQPPPGPVSPRPAALVAAEAFLQARRAGDTAAMTRLADSGHPRPDPFLIVDLLLRGYRLHLVAGATADAEEHLAAAQHLADLVRERRPELPGLPDLVQAWRGQDRAALDERHAFRRRAAEAIGRLRQNDLDQGLLPARAILDRPMAGDVYPVLVAWELGGALARCWRPDEGEAAYLASARMAAAMGWHTVECLALHQASHLARRRGDLRPAAAAAERLLSLCDAFGDSLNGARTRGQLAALQLMLGDRQRSRSLLAQVQAQAEAHGDRWLQADALLTLADAEAISGQPASALALAQQALPLAEDATVRAQVGPMAATCRRRIGLLQMELGMPGAALDSLEQAEAEHRAADAVDELALDLLAQAQVHLHLHREDRAHELLQQTLAAARRARDLGSVAQARALLVPLQMDAARTATAIGDLEQLLAETEQLGARAAATAVRRLMAEAWLAGSRWQEAKAVAEQALRQAETDAAPGEALAARLLLARALAALGDHAAAAAEFARAAEAALAQGDRPREAVALAGRAGVELARNRHRAAVDLARAAVERHGRVSRGLGEGGGRGLRAEMRGCCDTGLQALLALQAAGDAGDLAGAALWFLESARALVLADALHNAATLRAARLRPDLAEQEAGLRVQVANQQQALVAAMAARPVDTAALLAARQSLADLHRDLDVVSERVERETRRTAAVAAPVTATAATLCAALPGDVATVTYHAAGPRLLALVARSDGIRLFALGPAAAALQRAGAWRDLLATAETATADAERRAAAALHEVLVRPLAAALAGITRLWIVPDGGLAFLPFEALLDGTAPGGQRLAERLEIAYQPSATVLLLLQAEAAVPRGEGFLALGDPIYPDEAAGPAPARDVLLRDLGDLPRLPGTAAEVQDLAALFGPELPPVRRRTLLRDAASRTHLRDALAQTGGRLRVVHLACHGMLRPRLAGLVLSGGEVLDASELARLPLDADLTVLSACESAGGEWRDGEGVMGLARAGLLAGCPRLVVSHWRIDDASTRRLMADFHRRHLVDGMTPAAALAAVRRQRIAAGGVAAHPFHWAAFVLWGSGR